MVTVTVSLEPAVALFYEKIALQMQLPVEKILSDALFKLAGELSLEALRKK